MNMLLQFPEEEARMLDMLNYLNHSKSDETVEHILRVGILSEELSKMAGLSSDMQALIRVASPLHDIGKAFISDDILKKDGKLTEVERQVMETHCLAGYNLLRKTEGESFKLASIIALEHHERYDGKGYPNKLKGEQISISARIVTLVDVFDALASKRVYKEAWSADRIIDHITVRQGTHFDPYLSELFLDNYNVFHEMRDDISQGVGAI